MTSTKPYTVAIVDGNFSEMIFGYLFKALSDAYDMIVMSTRGFVEAYWGTEIETERVPTSVNRLTKQFGSDYRGVLVFTGLNSRKSSRIRSFVDDTRLSGRNVFLVGRKAARYYFPEDPESPDSAHANIKKGSPKGLSLWYNDRENTGVVLPPNNYMRFPEIAFKMGASARTVRTIFDSEDLLSDMTTPQVIADERGYSKTISFTEFLTWYDESARKAEEDKLKAKKAREKQNYEARKAKKEAEKKNQAELEKLRERFRRENDGNSDIVVTLDGERQERTPPKLVAPARIAAKAAPKIVVTTKPKKRAAATRKLIRHQDG